MPDDTAPKHVVVIISEIELVRLLVVIIFSLEKPKGPTFPFGKVGILSCCKLWRKTGEKDLSETKSHHRTSTEQCNALVTAWSWAPAVSVGLPREAWWGLGAEERKEGAESMRNMRGLSWENTRLSHKHLQSEGKNQPIVLLPI